MTYVAELRTPNLPQLYLWEPDAFKDKSASLTLYEGILIGIAGLLALFLTIVFVVRGAMIFPAAAALAWAVFAYVCIDFGFWRKMFGLGDASEKIWRAGVEATIGATLIIFLFAYLNLRRWHVRYTHFALAWLVLMAAVVGLSVYNPPIAAGVARISIATVAGVGFLLILSLAARGSDRAVMLIPTWYLLAVWVVAAGAAALGYLTNDLAAPGLVGGLVLIVMLIGFTVMQFAFSGSGGAMDSGPDAERRSLAMTGSGEAIFDWNVLTDEVNGSEAIESQLGLKRGALEGPAAGWLDVLHPLDRDRYTLALDGLLHQRSGRINHDLRLRGSDGHYFWYVLKARPVISADGEVVRVIGSLSDVTELKSAEERMLHDAVHDNLTGLPNRELFTDRLGAAILLAQKPGVAAPTVMVIDVDEFRSVNNSYGLSIGDSALVGGGPPPGAGFTPRRHAGSPGRRHVRRDRARRTGLDGRARQDRGLARCACLRRSASANGKSRSRFRSARRITIRSCTTKAAIFSLTLSSRSPTPRRPAAIGWRFSPPTCARIAPTGRRSRTTCGARSSAARSRFCSGPSCASRIARSPDSSRSSAGAIRGSGSSARMNSLRPPSRPAQSSTSAPTLWRRPRGSWRRGRRRLRSIRPSSRRSQPPRARCSATTCLLDVRSALGRHYVQRGSLKLAAAESLVMENPEYAAALLQRVREIGAALMLDRFGAGYTSLGHLPEYRFDAMRIDASLVRPNAFGARSPILRSIVAMAQEIGMDVISEGAETESDAVELAQLGCQFAQGAAFGQPMNAAAARKLMGRGGRLRRRRALAGGFRQLAAGSGRAPARGRSGASLRGADVRRGPSTCAGRCCRRSRGTRRGSARARRPALAGRSPKSSASACRWGGRRAGCDRAGAWPPRARRSGRSPLTAARRGAEA